VLLYSFVNTVTTHGRVVCCLVVVDGETLRRLRFHGRGTNVLIVPAIVPLESRLTPEASWNQLAGGWKCRSKNKLLEFMAACIPSNPSWTVQLRTNLLLDSGANCDDTVLAY
jgi:hypothetical protein